MNYQHQYHAGNFADVMKHTLLMELLEQLGRKDKPYAYIDTHAGEGLYDLSLAPAQKSGEYLDGIHRLMALNPAARKKAPGAVARYLDATSQLRSERGNGWYGGSPWYALQEMRPDDRAVLMEMVPKIHQTLDKNIHDRRAHIHCRDSYEGLAGMIPPREKRGLVLIDPPYEQERKDYPQLVKLLEEAYRKWPTGTFALWYPIKDRAQIERFEKNMVRTGIKKQLICELCPYPTDVNAGLNGSGLLVINPPWQFAESADQILQYLQPVLSKHPGSRASVRWLVGE